MGVPSEKNELSVTQCESCNTLCEMQIPSPFKEKVYFGGVSTSLNAHYGAPPKDGRGSGV